MLRSSMNYGIVLDVCACVCVFFFKFLLKHPTWSWLLNLIERCINYWNVGRLIEFACNVKYTTMYTCIHECLRFILGTVDTCTMLACGQFRRFLFQSCQEPCNRQFKTKMDSITLLMYRQSNFHSFIRRKQKQPTEHFWSLQKCVIDWN